AFPQQGWHVTLLTHLAIGKVLDVQSDLGTVLLEILPKWEHPAGIDRMTGRKAVADPEDCGPIIGRVRPHLTAADENPTCEHDRQRRRKPSASAEGGPDHH